jgi:hypothetical protein
MQLECPYCQQTLEYSGRRPGFCAFCGRPLPDTEICLATTAPPPPRVPSGAAADEVPAEVGEYHLVRPLGRGGMGAVWEAEQTGTGRRVALKLLAPELAHDADALARFLREGRLAAALSHPRSTFVFEAGEDAGRAYIVMELMPGRTLQDLVREQGPLPVNRAVDHVLDVIDGLEAAHALGIIHRDVKPSNCFLDGDGRVKVGDFGLSKSLLGDAALTRTGTFMGTPLFAAPEQVRGGAVDERTDIYAVGATLFYLLAGRGPFTGDVTAVIAQIASDPAPALRGLCPAVPRELDRIIARTLEKDPEQRYARLGQLRQALFPFATGGTSIADLGRRLAAFMVDIVLLRMLFVPAGIAVALATQAAGGTPDARAARLAEVQFIMVLVTWVLRLAYFAVGEGTWGCGVGKLLMGMRVVGVQGGPAGLVRGSVRSLFIPGGLGVSLLGLIPVFGAARPAPAGLPVLRFLLATEAFLLLHYAIEALCLLTMRARNGYRGVHDLASGTRVVRRHRAAGKHRLREVPVVVPTPLAAAGQSFGPFRTVATVGRSGPVTVLEARDDLLRRPVWIRLGDEGARPVPVERVALARPGRPRWLQGGTADGRRWDAFEGVVGAPLPRAVRPGLGLTWERGRFVLLELAEELEAAAADGTLPASLGLEQVWLDRNSRVKLLDEPIRPAAAADSVTAEATAPAPERALALLRATADLCTRGQVLPGHAYDFLQTLATKPADEKALPWAVGQLRDLCRRPARLRWDDRLGILSVTAGIEYNIYLLAGLLAGLLGWKLTGRIDGLVVTALMLDVALPAAIGLWMRGGPVFRLLGFEVRRASGRPASRLRCAWRNVVAWAPLLMSNAGLPVLVAVPDLLAVDPEYATSWNFLLLVVLLGAGSCLVTAVAIFAAIYGVVRPQRGIPDLLAGTCLVPR